MRNEIWVKLFNLHSYQARTNVLDDLSGDCTET